jgi:hypothetical protein
LVRYQARICCLRATPDTTQREAALPFARKAVELDSQRFNFDIKLTLGMAEYRSGHFADADTALLAAADVAKKFNPGVWQEVRNVFNMGSRSATVGLRCTHFPTLSKRPTGCAAMARPSK